MMAMAMAMVVVVMAEGRERETSGRRSDQGGGGELSGMRTDRRGRERESCLEGGPTGGMVNVQLYSKGFWLFFLCVKTLSSRLMMILKEEQAARVAKDALLIYFSIHPRKHPRTSKKARRAHVSIITQESQRKLRFGSAPLVEGGKQVRQNKTENLFLKQGGCWRSLSKGGF